MAKGNMRELMPGTAALIDDLRATFGAEYIDAIIRAGVRGQPVFSASENGHTVGTPVPVGTRILNDEHGRPCIVESSNGQQHKHVEPGRQPKQGGVKWE